MRPLLPILSALALAAAWPCGASAGAQPAPAEAGDEEEAAPGPVAPPAAPDPPPASAEAYEARVRQSFAAAESFQGPLDGGWTLSAPGEGRLYAIRFVDRPGRLEAAWRDLRRQGALGASGFVDEVQRAGPRLTLRFSPATGLEDVATLTARGDGWSGELVENGRRRAVSLAKTSP